MSRSRPADLTPVTAGDRVDPAVLAPRSVRRRLLKAALWIAVVVFAWFAVVRIVGRFDWSAVADAFALLHWWMLVPLLALLLARQVLNAVPLALYVPGLRLARSLENDLAANVVGTFAPPPGDIAIRVAQFRSWGVDPVLGMAGVTLNMLTFYAARFFAPVVGIALLAVEGVEHRQWVVALCCGAIATTMLVLLLLLLRSDELAARIGRTAGRAVRSVRSSVDPEQWAQATVRLRAQTADSLRRGLAPALLALVSMIVVDALVLLVSLRAVGVGTAELTVLDVLTAFFLAYPLTLMPLFGLGVLDAVLVGTWTAVAGVEHESSIVAATIVWRVVTLAGPLLMGGATLAWWRLRSRAGTLRTG
ncbi:lysylphosphatidylglycerol synthase domain-containing protein [Cellulomonas composti]|uniref:Uncharacterized protein n=1 Tax=Cellulomonas composti TaxID=266130 RepID=A0A511J6E5_9CELL|nr:lysylphosphatidylglycerol synthase domain-containing protein [Cellulomonas composti]GEL93580.1 hypothetical protein CCO02nite_02380 [Cellulomonas composti]